MKSQAKDPICAKALREDETQPMWVGEQGAQDKVAQDERSRWGFDYRRQRPSHTFQTLPSLPAPKPFLPQALPGLLS